MEWMKQLSVNIDAQNELIERMKEIKPRKKTFGEKVMGSVYTARYRVAKARDALLGKDDDEDY